MCLTVVDERPDVGDGRGFKILHYGRSRDLQEETIYSGPYHGIRVELGKWISDKRTGNITASDGAPYKTGFHLFKESTGMSKYAHSVSYAEVVATGWEDKRRVVVARRIYIHPKLVYVPARIPDNI